MWPTQCPRLAAIWGITGVSLRSAATRDALKGQGWAYTAVSLGAQTTPRRIEVLNDVLVASKDPGAVLVAMADPNVRIVSLTVTEKGYCHHPATGALNLDHPDIQHDLVHDLPVSAIGCLVRALDLRRRAGLRPFTVLSCDNLPENGRVVRGVVLDMARALDADLAAWIEAEGRFPCTMVDRITPATTPDDIARVADLIGTPDAAPVMHEPFSQWAVEDDFVDHARPDLVAAGAELVTDVTPHEHMKLRMLNGTHSALAYTGYLAGHQTISDTVADPAFAAYVRTLWSEIMPTVTAPTGVSLDAYADALMARYANPAIRHRTWQIAMDGSQKIPQRLLGTIADRFAAGQDAPALCLAVAAWMRYVCGADEQGQPIDVRDPFAERLAQATQDCEGPEAVVDTLLDFEDIFPKRMAEQLRDPVTKAARILWAKGARGAVQESAT